MTTAVVPRTLALCADDFGIAAGVSSVSLNASGALMLDTDALGEIAMSTIERVL